MRVFTEDERYALREQWSCGRAMADRDHQRAEMHRRAARYNSGSLTPCEMATAYALGRCGCDGPGPRWGDVRDIAGLPSPAVHHTLGYVVSDAWRARVDLIARQPGCADTVAAWRTELDTVDAKVAVR